ncbi:hypothetical protein RclHR1_04660015 [Rhizophagus clarus]|uniref:Ion transport domain-containing protein n=1 Tax=Rhizophagus clarus TaxID=94130 RepID=A0A2Z6S164_9GLOM|nr:hypothetical protein RclHR1_04660015 [Rhizophagus clarus]
MDETQNNTSTSETKIDISDNIKEHWEEIEKIPSEKKDDTFEKHRKSICRIFVSQYMDDTSTYNKEYGSDDYVVTYSSEDKSVLGWSIKENGPQPDIYFKIDEIDRIDKLELDYSVLSKKILLLCDKDNPSSDICNRRAAIGFLPNGDLIQVLGNDCKIYKYCFTDKPKNTVPWEYSQINDIKILKSINKQHILDCTIYQTKLFLFVYVTDPYKALQIDLLTMNLEKEYHGFCTYMEPHITTNKNQTLLATFEYDETHIYSMENGMLIYKCEYYFYNSYNHHDFFGRVEFITLKNTERLFICHPNDSKLVDPYQAYDEIDIFDDFNDTNVITKLNRKIFINNDNVCVTNGINGIDENKLQQLSNKIIYRNSIYTLSTFKIVQSMLNEIIDQDGIKMFVAPSYPDKIVLKNKVEIKPFGARKIVYYKNDNFDYIEIEKNNGHRIKNHGNIYDMNELYKQLIGKILKNEFDDSKHSIPPPTFLYRDVVDDVINDNLVSPKFGIEMLKTAIKEKDQDAIKRIFESTQDYSENYMTIISLNLAELCDHYPDFIIKYISRTSIMVSPYCGCIGDSKNTSLHSYTNIVYIKESNAENNYFKHISATYKRLIRYLRIKEEIHTVSFIVPFPQICVYQDDSKYNDHENKDHDTILKKVITGIKIIMMIPKSNSIWNKFLYKPKSILFCNIDSKNFYNWWNFAAIIDFKWKTFGRVYYYLIWLFYTIFYVCYSLASTLEQKSIPDFYFKLFFIISIIFASIFLIFEIRQCLWNYKCYFKDIWNLFDMRAYLLPIIASIFWLISKNQPLWLTAISIILKCFSIFSALIFYNIGYAQAFFIILRSNSINDDNNPRNVATKYDFVNPDGTISNTTTIIQDPDSNTNLFNWFPTSLLAVIPDLYHHLLIVNIPL